MPLVLPMPSAARGGVSSLITLLDTDISSNSSLIDSSPTDGCTRSYGRRARSAKVECEDVTSVARIVGGNRRPEHDRIWGSPDLLRVLRGAHWPKQV